jgi:hypothetical protein
MRLEMKEEGKDKKSRIRYAKEKKMEEVKENEEKKIE